MPVVLPLPLHEHVWSVNLIIIKQFCNLHGELIQFFTCCVILDVVLNSCKLISRSAFPGFAFPGFTFIDQPHGRPEQNIFIQALFLILLLIIRGIKTCKNLLNHLPWKKKTHIGTYTKTLSHLRCNPLFHTSGLDTDPFRLHWIILNML